MDEKEKEQLRVALMIISGATEADCLSMAESEALFAGELTMLPREYAVRHRAAYVLYDHLVKLLESKNPAISDGA